MLENGGANDNRVDDHEREMIGNDNKVEEQDANKNASIEQQQQHEQRAAEDEEESAKTTAVSIQHQRFTVISLNLFDLKKSRNKVKLNITCCASVLNDQKDSYQILFTITSSKAKERERRASLQFRDTSREGASSSMTGLVNNNNNNNTIQSIQNNDKVSELVLLPAKDVLELHDESNQITSNRNEEATPPLPQYTLAAFKNPPPPEESSQSKQNEQEEDYEMEFEKLMRIHEGEILLFAPGIVGKLTFVLNIRDFIDLSQNTLYVKTEQQQTAALNNDEKILHLDDRGKIPPVKLYDKDIMVLFDNKEKPVIRLEVESAFVPHMVGKKSVSKQVEAAFRLEEKKKNWDYLDREKRLRFCSFTKPHMQSFHFAWISSFLSYCGWFAISSALPNIIETGVATKAQVSDSTAVNLAGTVILRIFLGGLAEVYGPTRMLTFILFFGGCLVLLTAAVTNSAGLFAMRFFLAICAGSFVPWVFWIALNFSNNVIGTAMGFAAGLGNSGAGFVVFLVGETIYSLESKGYSSSESWRISMIPPGSMMLAFSLVLFFFSQDVPQGAWKNRKYGTHHDRLAQMLWIKRQNFARHKNKRAMKVQSELSRYADSIAQCEEGEKKAIPLRKWYYEFLWAFYNFLHVLLTDTRFTGFFDYKAWVAGLQYGVGTGIELSVIAELPNFYRFEFLCNNGTTATQYVCVSVGDAGRIASIFGFTNIWGRLMGGVFSDVLQHYYGVWGRHLSVFLTILGVGASMMVWASITDVQVSAGVLVLFGTIVAIQKGASLALVPFINPRAIALVTGVVGAVGNLTGVFFALMYRAFSTNRETFFYQGVVCLFLSLLAFCTPAYEMRTGKQVWLFNAKRFYYKYLHKWEPSLIKKRNSSDNNDNKKKGLVKKQGTFYRTYYNKFYEFKEKENEAGYV